MNERFKIFSNTQNLNHCRNYVAAGRLLMYLNFDISFSGNSAVKLSFECHSDYFCDSSSTFSSSSTLFKHISPISQGLV